MPNPGALFLSQRRCARDVGEAPMLHVLGQTESLGDHTFGLLVDSTLDYAIFMLDTEGRVASWNAGAQRLKLYKADEIIGRHFSVFYPPALAESGHPEFELQTALRHGSYSEEGWRVRKDGSRFWALVTITAIFDGDGHHIGFGKVTRDLTERREAEEKILFESTHDSLTGLPNQALLSGQLERSLARASRGSGPVAVFRIDLDGFRLFNDSLGYEAGDEILICVARRLRALVRPYDVVTRIAGDQFTMMAEDCSASDADNMATRIERALSHPLAIGARTIAISCSIGIAVGTGSQSPDELISASDAALHRAKRQGRAQHCVARSAGPAHSDTRLQIDQQLRTAIDNDELVIEYQPVVDITDGSVVSLEALTHWNHPSLGRVAPDRFVPVAEGSGLIRAIGDWVLQRACEQVAEASARIPDWAGGISVNASAYQLFDPGFVDRVEQTLERNDLEPSRLCLEVTESVLLRTDKSAKVVTRRLKDLGVHLSVDDFGTGYASLAYLRELPFDVVKVDRTFVADLATNRLDQILTRTIIEVGSTLGTPVIVEGVETEDQLRLVRGFGATLVQGYFFQRPRGWNVTERSIASGFSHLLGAG